MVIFAYLVPLLSLNIMDFYVLILNTNCDYISATSGTATAVQDTSTVTYTIRKRAIRKAGGDLQENKKFGRCYTGVSVECTRLQNKKSSPDQLYCFLFGARYCCCT